MKKSQITGRPLFYSLIIISAILILTVGVKQIKESSLKAKEIEKITYYTTLKNLIQKQALKSFGKLNEKTIMLPKGIEKICFIDRTKNISPFTNCNLNEEIKKYGDKNIFFEPFNKFEPIYIENFKLDESENPLCLKTFRSTVKLSLKSMGNYTLISTLKPSDKTSDCIPLLYNSPYNNSVDIVFLGYGYKNKDTYRKDVKEYIELFLETEPFKSNKEKINFYMIEDFSSIECEIKSWIKCNEFKAKTLASNCPNDYIIILVDRSKIKDMINPIRSSAKSNIAKINTADKNTVVLHEFGHIFGNLADEYVDEKYYSRINFDPRDYPNCDTTPCSKWSLVPNTSCFKGCSLSKYRRATKNSIMRSLTVNSFGPLNEGVLKERLDLYG